MTTPRTFTGKRALEARRLYDEGYSCRAIALKVGAGASTVSKWARECGLKFDRSQTAMAVRAHVVDLAAARLELAQKMTVAASDMLDKLDGPYTVYNFGGKDNTYEEHILVEPPVEVVRNAVVTAGIAFDKATRVVESSNDGDSDAKSLLADLGRALGITQPVDN